jgi:hypothetical protein
MKGISKEMVILIAIVVLVVVLLYFAWIKGFFPFVVGITESECHTDLMKECSYLSTRGDAHILKSVLKNCWGYVSKLPSHSNCESCKNQDTNEITNACSACCAQDLVGWEIK